MRIALLNLPLDNNYGGNLQRYALVKVLQDMGHDVTHIMLKVHYTLPWYKYPYSYTKRIIKRFLLRKPVLVKEESYRNQKYEESLDIIMPFYDKYIKHTGVCYNIRDVVKETKDVFDVFIVGSDQVWRKDMTSGIGIENYFLKFVEKGKKRIAYSVSLGGVDMGLSSKEMKIIKSLYNKFYAVSVREMNSIELFEKAGWTNPKCLLTLDPVLLLDKADYLKMIKENNTVNKTEGKCFCYILDNNEQVEEKIKSNIDIDKVDYIVQSLNENVSIPQWISNIYYAHRIITDSYHGVVLSILFEKNFFYIGNERRGNTRVSSLLGILGIDASKDSNYSWEMVRDNIYFYRKRSIAFLKRI